MCALTSRTDCRGVSLSDNVAAVTVGSLRWLRDFRLYLHSVA